MYSTTIGRFTSEDPAEDDRNLYRYAENNPINVEDPSGRDNIRATDTLRIPGGPFSRDTVAPRDRSPIVWNITDVDYSYGIPSVPFHVEHFTIGRYVQRTQTVKLREEFGGAELPLWFLEGYAESVSALGGKERLRALLAEAPGLFAFQQEVHEEYLRLRGENPPVPGQGVIEFFAPYGQEYEQRTYDQATLNVLQLAYSDFKGIVALQRSRLEDEYPDRESSELDRLALTRAEASTGIIGSELQSEITERSSQLNTRLAGISLSKARKALLKLGVRNASARLLRLTQRIGLKGLRKYALLRRQGLNALKAFNDIKSQLHHAIPKFLGGHPSQDLVRLPDRLHSAYHGILRTELRSRGLAHLIGNTTRVNQRMLARNPKDLEQAYNAIVSANLEFDRLHSGYNLTQAFWSTYLNGNFKIAPFGGY